MSTVTLYAFEDECGNEDTWTTFDATKAKAYAQKHGRLCTAQVYEWSDSEPAWDFRPANEARIRGGRPTSHPPSHPEFKDNCAGRYWHSEHLSSSSFYFHGDPFPPDRYLQPEDPATVERRHRDYLAFRQGIDKPCTCGGAAQGEPCDPTCISWELAYQGREP